MQDRELVLSLKSGSTEAFKELVEQYRDRVINTCYGFLKNKEDAEDIAQEVFIEVYRSISAFREESKLSTWIYRIALSKSLDFIRKNNRKKRKGRIQKFLSFHKEAAKVSAPAANSPETRLENLERVQILRQAVDSLPENQRIAITLNRYEGFSYKEIADIIDTTLPALEALIHRAKKVL